MKKKTRIKRRRKSTNTHTVDLVRAPNHMAKKRRKTNPKHAAPPDIIIKKKVWVANIKKKIKIAVDPTLNLAMNKLKLNLKAIYNTQMTLKNSLKKTKKNSKI